jgi:hypothetical protein
VVTRHIVPASRIKTEKAVNSDEDTTHKTNEIGHLLPHENLQHSIGIVIVHERLETQMKSDEPICNMRQAGNDKPARPGPQATEGESANHLPAKDLSSAAPIYEKKSGIVRNCVDGESRCPYDM